MTPILNRAFQHPADGWYMIEPMGEHPNRAAGVLQVIDEEAANRIVRDFNAAAARPNFPGMLVDHEHFSHDQDKETRAFGWLTGLQARADGIYGQIRWSDTGRAAVDGGDYRFFSTEYAPADLVALNTEPAKHAKDAKAELQRKRPCRLAGLTLTNRPNNKGGKPITNRDGSGSARGSRAAAGGPPGAPNSNVPFADAAGAASAANQNEPGRDTPHHRRKHMNRLTEKLGLAAEASEDAILDALTSIMNRATTAESALAGAKASSETLRAENKTLREAQIESDLELHKNRFAPEQRENWKELLALNRESALKALAGLPELKPAAGAAKEKLVVNRATAKTPADHGSGNPGDPLKAAVEDYRVKNRCSFEDAWNAVKREKPELFKTNQ